jgi:predicted esterase
MIEGHLTVRRTARYFALWEPGPAPWDLWIVLHGYRQSAARFLKRFADGAGPGIRVVAPEGLSRFYVDEDGGVHGPEHRVGASWMTREDRENEIRDYVGYLDDLVEALGNGPDGVPDRLFVLGFSQGCHTAARWITMGRARPDSLVLWGGNLPLDFDVEKGPGILRMLGVTLVAGRADRLVPRAALERERDRLEEWRVPVRLMEHGGGHEIESAMFRHIAGDPAPGPQAGPDPGAPDA